MVLKNLIIGILIVFCFGGVNAKEVVLASSNYPPFYGEDLENYGPLIELITQSYKNVDYEVKIMFLPWARAMGWSKSGDVDGMVGVWHSPERAEHFLYSDPLFPNRMGFYKRKNEEISYKDYVDLKQQGYIIGSVRGYILPEGIEESGIQVHFVNEEIQSFKLLSADRVDLIVVDKQYARYMLDKTELQRVANNIEWMGPVLEEKQQYLIISKRTENAHKKMEAFNKGLKLLRETGEFKKIMERYGLEE